MTIIYRSVKGSNLTPAEFDGNFSDVDGRITTLEAAGIAKEISTVAVVGNVLTFTYTDATTDSVVLPTVQFTDVGEWAPDSPYAAMDIVHVEGAVYLVIYPHTSASESEGFDPGANDGMGHDFYALLIDGGPVPVGGDTAQVLTKQSDSDSDVVWEYPFPRTQTIVNSTVVLALTDINTFNACTHASGCAVSITDDTLFPIDFEAHYIQLSGNPVSFQAETDITLHYASDCNPNTDVSGAVATIKKIGDFEWVLFGRLEQI